MLDIGSLFGSLVNAIAQLFTGQLIELLTGLLTGFFPATGA